MASKTFNYYRFYNNQWVKTTVYPTKFARGFGKLDLKNAYGLAVNQLPARVGIGNNTTYGTRTVPIRYS